MNFGLVAFGAVIGVIGLILYIILNKRRENKEKPKDEKKRWAVANPSAMQVGKKGFVKARQSETNIITEIFNIKDSRVEVNISESGSTKRGQNLASKKTPQ